MSITTRNLLGALVIIIVAVLIFSNYKPDSVSWTTRPVPGAPTGRMPSQLIGKTFACTNGFLAALTADEAERLQEFIKDNDKAAIMVMAVHGRVPAIKKGSTATIEDIDIWNGVEQFRVRGNPTSLYTTIGMIE